METNDKKFPEQQAPDKNTDNAFVQVGRDGQPVIPKTTADDSHNQQETSGAIEQEPRK